MMRKSGETKIIEIENSNSFDAIEKDVWYYRERLLLCGIFILLFIHYNLCVCVLMLRIMIGEKQLKEGRLWSSKNIICHLTGKFCYFLNQLFLFFSFEKVTWENFQINKWFISTVSSISLTRVISLYLNFNSDHKRCCQLKRVQNIKITFKCLWNWILCFQHKLQNP